MFRSHRHTSLILVVILVVLVRNTRFLVKNKKKRQLLSINRCRKNMAYQHYENIFLGDTRMNQNKNDKKRIGNIQTNKMAKIHVEKINKRAQNSSCM